MSFSSVNIELFEHYGYVSYQSHRCFFDVEATDDDGPIIYASQNPSTNDYDGNEELPCEVGQ